MLVTAWLNNVVRQLASFISTVSCVKSIRIKGFSIEAHVASSHVPSLTAMKWGPEGFEIKYKDSVTRLPAMPSPDKLDAILREHAAPYVDIDMLNALACKLSQHGIVYIESIAPKMLDLFLKIWSDAYGEDHPDTFMKEHPNGHEIYGFVRTNLTPAQIAAKNNEDGDDDYNPDPLFNKED
jgi:hypothetical protein